MISRTHRDQRGMATAEYSVATLGAVSFALVLFKLGASIDAPWWDHLVDVIREALSWKNVFKGLPRLGLRLW